MASLIPVDRPALQPLAESFEQSAIESELKAAFMAVFEKMIRPRERALNLYGTPHLGDHDLLARTLSGDGLAVVRSDIERLQFLLRAWRSRNPKRGMLFLRTYLQTVWPNQYTMDQLWHPVAGASEYPKNCTPKGAPGTHFLTSRVKVVVPATADDGTGLLMMQKALRTSLPARLVLELELAVELTNTGENGLALANGALGVAPIYMEGTLL